MEVTEKVFKIYNKSFEWGSKLDEVSKSLNLDIKSEDKLYNIWPSIRPVKSNFYGLKTCNSEVESKYIDGPVLRFRCDVLPIKKRFFERLHTPYISILSKVLGKPEKTSSNYSSVDLKSEYASSHVVFSAEWLVGEVKISLSVYGGIRNDNVHEAGAGIFVDWLNEEKAASEQLEMNKERANELLEADKKGVSKRKFILEHNQFSVSLDFSLDFDKQIGYKTSRESKVALYYRELFSTPDDIKTSLRESEIDIFKISSKECFIVNKYETIKLNENSKIVYYNILPARGGGGQEVVIDGFRIQDSNESVAIIKLVDYLEKDYDFIIEKKERYDD